MGNIGKVSLFHFLCHQKMLNTHIFYSFLIPPNLFSLYRESHWTLFHLALSSFNCTYFLFLPHSFLSLCRKNKNTNVPQPGLCCEWDRKKSQCSQDSGSESKSCNNAFSTLPLIIPGSCVWSESLGLYRPLIYCRLLSHILHIP